MSEYDREQFVVAKRRRTEALQLLTRPIVRPANYPKGNPGRGHTVIEKDGVRLAVVLFNLGGPDGPAAVKPFLFNLFNDPAISA